MEERKSGVCECGWVGGWWEEGLVRESCRTQCGYEEEKYITLGLKRSEKVEREGNFLSIVKAMNGRQERRVEQ